MAAYQNVKLSIADRVALITIDHPPVNTLDTQTIAELEAAFEEAVASEEVKAIVITGAGRTAFVAGADIGELATLQTPEQALDTALRGQAVLNKIEASAKPVIAAINGFALGGGLELAMACHIRVAGDRARLGQPEINLGIMPGFGGTQRLPRLVSRGKALEMLLTGEHITAHEAHRIGLVDQVVPGGEVVQRALDLARKIAAKSKVPIAAILDAVREGERLGLAEGLRYEAERFAQLTETEDMHEGLTAFLEKRQPQFTDR